MLSVHIANCVRVDSNSDHNTTSDAGHLSLLALLPECRAIRLGYNVLLLDTDVTILDDPYKYFKQLPFRDMVIINQEEGHTTANGGVLYVQVQFTLACC